MSVRVVATGLGTVGAHGAGRAALTAQLLAGQPTLTEIDRSAGYHRAGGARFASLTRAADLAPLLPAGAARRMSTPSRLAVAATRLALVDAGLTDGDPAFAATAIVAATLWGPAAITEQLLKAILESGPENASPALFTESVASAAASQMALAVHALGPNLTITQRDCGPLLALGEGMRLLRRGHAVRVLVAAVDEMVPVLHSVLDRFGALAHREASGEEVGRPFDRRRSGGLAADGATVVVLERAETAAARGARVLCEVLEVWGGFDATASAMTWGDGAPALAAALARGLARSGVGRAEIDRIVAAAAGHRGGDRIEARTLATAWGEHPLPPVLAPLGTTGYHGGGLLGGAIVAAAGESSYPTAGFAELDPELALVPHDGSPLPPARRLLVSALAPGGAAAWALLAPPTPAP